MGNFPIATLRCVMPAFPSDGVTEYCPSKGKNSMLLWVGSRPTGVACSRWNAPSFDALGFRLPPRGPYEFVSEVSVLGPLGLSISPLSYFRQALVPRRRSDEKHTLVICRLLMWHSYLSSGDPAAACVSSAISGIFNT